VYIPTGPPLFLLLDLGLQNRPRFSPYNWVASHMGPLESLGASSVYLGPIQEQCSVYTHKELSLKSLPLT
jgi:hypothetical protein